MSITSTMGERVVDGARVPAGYEQKAVSNTAVALGSIPADTDQRPGATGALIYVETAAVRFRDDGTDPTSSVGFPLDVGVPFFYTGDLSKLKFIRQSADATVNVLYYR